MAKTILIPICLLLLSLPGLAADATGKWVGRERSNQLTMDLKADGGSLTGKVEISGRNGPIDVKISDGKVDGNNIMFSVKRSPGAAPVIYKGKIEGNILKLNAEHTSPDGKVVVIKVEARRCPPDCGS